MNIIFASLNMINFNPTFNQFNHLILNSVILFIVAQKKKKKKKLKKKKSFFLKFFTNGSRKVKPLQIDFDKYMFTFDALKKLRRYLCIKMAIDNIVSLKIFLIKYRNENFLRLFWN